MPSVRSPAVPTRGEMDRWKPMLGKLLAGFDGALALQLPDGSCSQFCAAGGVWAEPTFMLCLRDPLVLRTLLLGRNPLRFADAYFRGALDLEGDIFAALSLKDYLHALQLSVPDRVRVALRLLGHAAGPLPERPRAEPAQANAVRSHSRQENRDAIAFHYDLSNEFFALWLDPAMVYSCAYFERPDMTLEQAQVAKLDHICRKLQLQPGEQFLDVGCGWGALVLHAARHYGVRAHGITLSQRQFGLARARIREAGLGHQVTVEWQDYRDLPRHARFDKIASVGMFEHVGLKNLPQYFDAIHRALRPQGLFLNHGITHNKEGWGGALSSLFINRYVFPDGELDTVGNIQRAMERAHFEILDTEGLRPHYALTLREWVKRLDRQHAAALQHVNESTYRVWRLYMAASALEFESGGLGVYQILSAPRGRSPQSLPMSRRHLYP